MERALPLAPLQAGRVDTYAAAVEFRVLGPIEVTENGHSYAVGGPKQRAVLALLIAHAGRSVSTGSLIEGVYGDAPPSGARRSIQTYISNLRSEIGDVIHSTSEGYELAVERDRVDALMFEDIVATATSDPPEEASGRLRSALELWRGHPYADVDAGEAVDAEVRRLAELRMQALEARIDAELAAGYHRDLIAELESLTIEYPLRERFTEQQMLALYRSGRQAEALRAYERTRTRLVNEMGLDASRDLRDLEQRIIEQDSSLDFSTPLSIRRGAVLVCDIAEPRSLAWLPVEERSALIDHVAEVIAEAADRHSGDEFATSGSATFVLFPDATEAALAAGQMLRGTSEVPPEHRLRVAIDVGDVETGDSVVGPPVNRAAAIVSAGHGGQVLLSAAAHQAITEASGGGWVVRSLGPQELRGLERPESVYQLVVDGLPDRFPPLRTEAPSTATPITTHGLAGYEIREEVGSGVFGVVHRAYQPSVGREVAVKVIRPEWANRPEFVRRFEVEAQLIARLEHPHIVPLYDYWREPDRACLVMRWLRGGSLEDRIDAGPLTLDETTAILAQVAPALAAAHRSGIVHRDLKPANVLFDPEGNAYLTDFGIAKDLAATPPTHVDDDVLASSPAYATPEQLHGEAITPATDVHALGMLLADCLTGSRRPPSQSRLTTIPPQVRTVIDRAMAAGPAERYESALDLLDAWLAATGDSSIVSSHPTYTETRNPYKGLSAFTELDAEDFHGRDDLVDQLLASVAAHDLVAAVGPSGIGKSSVVRAGLIPSIRSAALPGSAEWFVTSMVPGTHPFDELSAALLRVAVKAPPDLEDLLRKDERGLTRAIRRYLPEQATVVVVIDQFEELFTLCKDPSLRSRFLDTLVSSLDDPQSRLKVVCTIRADFFDRPLAHSSFGSLLQNATVPITAPSRDGLLEMITQPAAAVGVSFEAGLPERIVDDVVDQPGGLPLLEFALTELFEERSSDVITNAEYDESAGVLAALGRRAESVFGDLAADRQEACRDVFIRCVTVNPDGFDTRRRVRMSELMRLPHDPAHIREAISAFLDQRLLTTDVDVVTRSPTVEFAHEALLHQWERLHLWLDGFRDDLLAQRRIMASAADWKAKGEDPAYLLTGARLARAEALEGAKTVSLTSFEHDYIEHSLAADEASRARRRRTRNVLTGTFAAIAVVASFLAILAVISRNDANRQKEAAVAAEAEARTSEENAAEQAERADEQAQLAAERELQATTSATLAEARALLASSSAVLTEDPELAVLLALAGAEQLGNDTESVAAVRRAAREVKTIYSGQSPGGRASVPVTGDMSPDGTVVAVSTGFGGRFEVRDIDTGDVRWEYDIGSDRPEEIDISLKYFAGGEELLVAVNWYPPTSRELSDPPEAAGLYVFDASDGTLLRELPSGRCGSALVWPRFAESFIANQYSDTHALIMTIAESSPACGGSTPPSWDVHLVDLQSGERTRVISDWSARDGAVSVALSADASTMVLPGEWIPSGGYETLIVDTTSNATIGSLPVSGHISTFALSGDGSLAAVATGLPFQHIDVYDTASGDFIRTLLGGLPDVFGMAFTGNADRIVSTGSDGVTRIWDVASGRLLDTLKGAEAGGTNLRLDASDRRLAVYTQGNTFRIYDLETNRLAESDAMIPCAGTSDAYNLRGGVQGTGGPTVVYAICDSLFVRRGVHLWDRQTGDVRRYLPYSGQSVAATLDGQRFVAASLIVASETSFITDTYKVFDASTSESVIELGGLCSWDDIANQPTVPGCHRELERPVPPMAEALPVVFDAFDLDLSDDGRFVGGAHWDSVGMVWDASSGEPLLLTSGTSVAFTPDGDRVAFFAEEEGELNLFETETFMHIATHPTDTTDGAGQYLAFALDGEILVGTGGIDGSPDVAIYDGRTLEPIATLEEPHQGETRDIAVSRNGQMIATAGSDGWVRIWDATTLQLLHELPISDAKVQSVDFVDGDTRIVAASLDGRVVEILLDKDAYISSVRERLPRGFTSAECGLYFLRGSCPEFDIAP